MPSRLLIHSAQLKLISQPLPSSKHTEMDGDSSASTGRDPLFSDMDEENSSGLSELCFFW